MKVKFIRLTLVDGKPVEIDAVRDLPTGEAKYLIALRKCVVVGGEKAAKEPDGEKATAGRKKGSKK